MSSAVIKTVLWTLRLHRVWDCRVCMCASRGGWGGGGAHFWWTMVRVCRNMHTKGRRRKEEEEEVGGGSSPTLNDKCLACGRLCEVHTNKWLSFARSKGHNCGRWVVLGCGCEGGGGGGVSTKERGEALNAAAAISDLSICMRGIVHPFYLCDVLTGAAQIRRRLGALNTSGTWPITEKIHWEIIHISSIPHPPPHTHSHLHHLWYQTMHKSPICCTMVPGIKVRCGWKRYFENTFTPLDGS